MTKTFTRPAFTLASILCFALLAFSQGDHVPAYNHRPPKAGEVGPILRPEQLDVRGLSDPLQVRVYEIAAKIPGVLNQMPCYCYCERMGHKSLHSCFEGDHAAHCDVCMKEAVYAYQQTKLKKTPAQIRAGIIAGKWKTVDLEKATL
ncbi:MAG: CYCXC family (seleno)protein [Terriglobales bacterium]